MRKLCGHFQECICWLRVVNGNFEPIIYCCRGNTDLFSKTLDLKNSQNSLKGIHVGVLFQSVYWVFFVNRCFWKFWGKKLSIALTQQTFTHSNSNRDSWKRCETCSKLTKTLERRSGVVIVNFQQISQLFQFLLLNWRSKSLLGSRNMFNIFSIVISGV